MKYFIACALLLSQLNCFAANNQLNETLVRIINQINAIKPLLDEAEKENNPNDRIQFHINNFTDYHGKKHLGLRGDLMAIRNNIIDYINSPVIAPRKIKPLEHDFVRKP